MQYFDSRPKILEEIVEQVNYRGTDAEANQFIEIERFDASERKEIPGQTSISNGVPLVYDRQQTEDGDNTSRILSVQLPHCQSDARVLEEGDALYVGIKIQLIAEGRLRLDHLSMGEVPMSAMHCSWFLQSALLCSEMDLEDMDFLIHIPELLKVSHIQLMMELQ
ncbi:hypothetical protein QQF64_033889 [Cirrhinus molitorella]|uniref:Uncharacterized protein n=1 Tax=Cirrhinus molitorella TaxID=172907 RepID=A0ABR3MV46_9TELE